MENILFGIKTVSHLKGETLSKSIINNLKINTMKKVATFKKKSKANKVDIYEKINKVVLEGLEKDGLKWFMGWKDSGGPINWATEKAYKGFNIFWLNAGMRGEGYSANEWMTYNQAKTSGGQVKRGEQSSMVFFWKINFYDKETKKFYNTIEDIKKAGLKYTAARFKKCFTLRNFNVFNIDQIDGLEAKNLGKDLESKYTPNERAEDIIYGYIGEENSPTLVHGSGGAYYQPQLDRINMPEATDFCDTDTYFKTLFHEMAHSTGHTDRLNRDTLMDVKQWGDTTYAKEELVAEISAMYLAGECGLNPKDDTENSQAYIKSWTKRIKDSKNECVSAMIQAVKSVDLIKGIE
jgi:antirestriction protein ArdC